MPNYKQLNQRHPSSSVAAHEELCALYEGGEKLERLHSRFLPKRPRERQERYDIRLKEAEYRNYVGPIIDYFTSLLFVSAPVLKAKDEKAEPVAETDAYWTDLRGDCDGGGTNIDAFFKQRLTDSMIGRTGWLRLHAPNDGGVEPVNAAEFEERKLGAVWLEGLCATDVLDWDAGDDGRLIWATTHKRQERRESLTSDRDTIVETWHYLTAESIETYQLRWNRKEPPGPETEVPLIGSVPHRFGSVPLVCLDLPPALWVCKRLRSPQLAHFRKQSALNWSLAATAYAMPVINVADVDEYVKQSSGAGYEIVLGVEEKYSWEAPPTAHFDALSTEIAASKDEIFRIAHQMALGVENNAAAVGRSAESKASDQENTRVVLVAFSRIVKETIQYTLNLIAAARGEKLSWSVEGLDDFAALEIDAFVTTLGTLKEKVGAIPSKSWQTDINIRLAEALQRDAPEERKALYRKEIQAGTADPVEEREAELEAAKSVFGGPPVAERPGKNPPNGAAAKAGAGRRSASRKVGSSKQAPP